MEGLDQLLSDLAGYAPGADHALVRRAYEFAVQAHDGQPKSGDHRVPHPLAVARIIAELRLDVASVCAGMLHHRVEVGSATVEQLGELFGREIAFLADGVTRLRKLPYSTADESQAETVRKMLFAMARDLRVVLIKLCDRLATMRSLHHLPPEQRERIAADTMLIDARLANRLGIEPMKIELEDLAFKYLHPGEYEQLAAEVAQRRSERLEYIHHVEKLIHKEMTEHGVPCEVTGRAKHLWSIYQKMQRTQRSYVEINDKIGFRVITESMMHCYQCLGVAHQTWTPVPGRFKDYIALPKPSLYQSLHTSVIGPRGEIVEIQIRTRDMHWVATEGFSAHWKYKEGSVASVDDSRFTWLRRQMVEQKLLRDPTEGLASVNIDPFGDEVYAFTPQGDVKALPRGACPIDFAYAVHSSIGDHCTGARVNGVIVPLRYQLRNGDTVEILTSPNRKPNKDWLALVKTQRARNRICQLLRIEQRDKAVVLGSELLDRALRPHNTTLARTEPQLALAARGLQCADVEDLLTRTGRGEITVQQVLDRALEPTRTELEALARIEDMPRTLRRKLTRRSSARGIQVAGEADILVRLARCCSPLPGDPIVGFITRGRGVTVHRRDCDKGLDLAAERRVDVEWTGNDEAQHEVAIQIVCADKPGLLSDISQSFSDNGVNISQAHCRATEDGRAVNTFHASVRDLDQLKSVIRSLSRIKGVYSVDRVSAET